MSETMTDYLGIKKVKAKTMCRGIYNTYKGWDLPEGEDPLDAGYLVVYPDGYESWCPKIQFELANRTLSGMTYGEAVEALRIGFKVARKGWNGVGMFIFKQVPIPIPAEIVPKMTSLPQAVKDEFIKRKQGPNYVNQMAIVKADGTVDSWVASSSDTFADDWFIVETK